VTNYAAERKIDMTPISEDEYALLNHVMMWGSGGYPIDRIRHRWVWSDYRGVRGSPIRYKTKREATAAFERWHTIALARLRELGRIAR